MNLFRAVYRLRRERNKSEEISQLKSQVEGFEGEREFRIRRTRFSRRKVVAGFLAFYAVAVPAYFWLGMQPSESGAAAAYAKEAATATGRVEIASIGLDAPMTEVELDGRTLRAPDYIVGRYTASENKVLLMGHSTTVFTGLSRVRVGDEVVVDGKRLNVVEITTLAKEEISMREILKTESEPTVVLMTCAGEPLGGQDYTHRLVVYAR